jgi:IS30 family transposase
MSHHHLTRDQRSELGILKSSGCDQQTIANLIGVHPSTISREIARCKTNLPGGYHAATAARLATARRARANGLRRKLVKDPLLRRYVVSKLRLGWSPEQVCGRLKQQYDLTLSHETIYAWVYRSVPQLKLQLRHKGTHFRHKRGTNARWLAREQAKRRWIDERPAVANERGRLGDWEGDTVVSKQDKARILTYTERVSGFEIARMLTSGTALAVSEATIPIFLGMKANQRYSLTLDNGVEFANYEYIEASTTMPIYFAHPYHSWERGTNENANGLLRQYFPKKTALAHVTQVQLDQVVKLLNTRPRKRLGYRTPREVFTKTNCNSS